MSNILIACECSGIVRDAFIRRGYNAISCDLQPTERPGPHIRGDVLEIIQWPWDMMIAHPPCTRLANAGVRWLHRPPTGKTKEQMWNDLAEGVDFYRAFQSADHIQYRAIENPIMHCYAKDRLNLKSRQIIQPWQYGEPFFKGTGFELYGLPDLIPTNTLTRPERGTYEYKRWSAVHYESPGPDRAKNRSRTYPGIADAIAEQWGGILTPNQGD